MEGAKGNVPAALRPFTWSPGWNSNQAINKFQAEPGGALTGGDTAVSIIRRRQTGKLFEPAAPSRVEADELPLVARHHIFGSEELSVRAPAIAELVPRSYCMIHPDVATALSVESGDGLSWEADGEVHALEVIVDRGVAPGCVVYAYGFGNSFVNTRPLLNSTAKVFRRAENWTRRPSRTPNVITSDKDR
jgi:NADH-quinone oxidoreductase subunit G